MSDHQHRRDLQERIEGLEMAVAGYFAKTHPSLLQVRRPITHAVDDACMLLNMESVREDYFLPFALMFLESAERQFEDTKALINKYGGPESARAIGGREEP